MGGGAGKEVGEEAVVEGTRRKGADVVGRGGIRRESGY